MESSPVSPPSQESTGLHRGIGGGIGRRTTRRAPHRRGRDRRSHPGREQARAGAAARARAGARDRRALADVPSPARAFPGGDERRDQSPRRLLRPAPAPRRRFPRPVAIGAAALARELRHLTDPSLRRVRRHLLGDRRARGDRDLCAAAASRRAARPPHDRDGRPGGHPVSPVRTPLPHRRTRHPGPDRRPDDDDRGSRAGYA